MIVDAVSRTDRIATFFGGAGSASAEDVQLAYKIGETLGNAGMTVQHGGHGGLMEQVARGAAAAGGHVVAVTLAGTAWGAINPHVSQTVQASTMGERLHQFLDNADLVVAMGGGLGSAHELTAALWYATTIRPVRVWLTGTKALRLAAFLRGERWLFESRRRSLGFLRQIPDLAAAHRDLATLVRQPYGPHTATTTARGHR